MRGEFALPAAELVKQRAKLLDVRCKFHRLGTALLLINFRARLDAVRPLKRHPQSRPFIDRAFEERGGRADLLFAQCCPKRVAEMTNHLMSGHVAPTPRAVRTHSAQTIKDLAAVGII